MKKFLLFIAALALVVILWSVVRKPKPEKAEPLVSETPQPSAAVVPKPRPAQKFRDMVVAPRREVNPTESKKPVPASCRSFWKQILAMDFGQESLWESSDKLPGVEGCSPPKELEQLQAGYRKYCKVDEGAATLSSTDQFQCKSALFFYRAYITDYLTEGRDLKTLRNPHILVDKMFARFMTDPKEGGLVAERLLEIQPDYYPAAQAVTIAKLVELDKSDNSGGMTPEQGRQFDGLVEKLKQLNPTDPQNIELDMFSQAMVHKDPLSARERAYTLYKTDPSSHVGPYYLAWAEYKIGNPEKGAYWLDVAGKIAPDNQAVKETREAIRKNPKFYLEKDRKKKSVFRGNFSFRIENPDF